MNSFEATNIIRDTYFLKNCTMGDDKKIMSKCNFRAGKEQTLKTVWAKVTFG